MDLRLKCKAAEFHTARLETERDETILRDPAIIESGGASARRRASDTRHMCRFGVSFLTSKLCQTIQGLSLTLHVLITMPACFDHYSKYKYMVVIYIITWFMTLRASHKAIQVSARGSYRWRVMYEGYWIVSCLPI